MKVKCNDSGKFCVHAPKRVQLKSATLFGPTNESDKSKQEDFDNVSGKGLRTSYVTNTYLTQVV
jgi:hypothetical protein